MKRTRAWAFLHVAVVVGFLATVASYYHPQFGFTPLLTLPSVSHGVYELPKVRAVPHWDDPTGSGYDGQFYAQLAVEPLLKDPAIDKALDLAPYRARRILFSWTAYALGLGRTSWILEAYALQNVAVWLAFAWVLLRWFPIGSARSFALWCACLLTHGMLSSVRYALIDAPSALLITAAVVAAESARPWLTAIVLGAAGLARETNLLGITLLLRLLKRTPRSWLRVGACVVIALLPLLLWMDYLRSIYRGGALATGDNITMPFSGLIWKMTATAHEIVSGAWGVSTLESACVMAAFVTQAAYVGWLAAARRARESAWLPIALPYAALGLVAHRVVWDGSPGAITRVALPLALGFNVLARRAPWPLLVFGNLGVVAGVLSFVFRR